MRRVLAPVAALFMLHAPAAHAAEAWLSMVYTNALHEALPFDIFTKGDWSPDPKARFVKLHLYFDGPILMKGLEIDDCGSNLDPDISIFFNFDQWILSREPALSGEVPQAMFPKRKGSVLRIEGFEESLELRSLTINFENNRGFRICGIKIMDPDGKPYAVHTPLVAGGTVGSDSVLAPRSAYDPVFLFDSRFEYGWASDGKARDVGLSFKFDAPRRVEKIRLWNGYQRSVPHCVANSRARRIRVTGDGGYRAEVTVEDVLGSQVVDLPKPFEGRTLELRIVDSFAGKSYKDLVISELRFFDGTGWFMLDPAPQLRRAIAENRAAFAKAGTQALLNDSFVGGSETENMLSNARFRLRADGSFYVSGYAEEYSPQDEQGDEHQYFALGNYEIKKAGSGGIRLRLFGLYYETEIYGDCNGCGRDCNRTDLPEGMRSQTIFQEYVTIRPGAEDGFELANESGGRKLPIRALSLTREGER